MKKIFFDTEFTGLHQATTLISIGLLAETGENFYAEFTDYDKSQVNDWLQKNVVDKLYMKTAGVVAHAEEDKSTAIMGTKTEIAAALKEWLAQFGAVQMWSDCLAYDWALFNDLLADYTNGYPQLPEGVHYIPMDICTLFYANGINPDISREAYALPAQTPGKDYEKAKHNALWDAQIIKACFDKLTLS